LVEPFRLKRKEDALLLPTHIILQSLKDRKIDSQLALVNLLIDFWCEDITKSASYADLDAREAFLELSRATFIGSRRTSAIES
jgi:hypothetical protein